SRALPRCSGWHASKILEIKRPTERRNVSRRSVSSLLQPTDTDRTDPYLSAFNSEWIAARPHVQVTAVPPELRAKVRQQRRRSSIAPPRDNQSEGGPPIRFR